MGLMFTKLWSIIFGGSDVKIIIVGLNAAGKTTILYRLLTGEAVTTSPTIGSNVEEVTYKSLRFIMWDIGGQESLRSTWATYYMDTKCVILVIDSTDRERLGTSKEELYRMLTHEDLRGVSLLILANKQDLEGAMSAAEISEYLNLTSIKDHGWHIQPCSGLTGDGLYSGLDFVVDEIQALRVLLNLQQPVKKQGTDEPVWKILIYDRAGQDILSPLLKIGELRDIGVTLHLQLHADRDPIPDTPAVYFCMPTKENVERICRDCKSELYDSNYINFISAVPRSLLEELAHAALEAEAVQQIQKVCDQYVNFISLEDDLFCLSLGNKESISYFALNNPQAKDTDIITSIDEIVDSLFSVLVTMGVVPIIRSPRNNAAEMVAQKLDQKLRDHLKNTRNSLFTDASHGSVSFQRPVLVILDRNIDLPTLMHHTWTYQALVHDLLSMKSNRVTIPPKGGDAAARAKNYDLDSSKDFFWGKHRGSPFPTVATEVEAELNKYKEETAEITALSEAIGMDPNEINMDNLDLNENAKKLTSAVSNLPQLTEKKRLIDMHTTMAWALLDQIRERGLDTFFEAEERCMSRGTLEKPILSYLQDPKGLANDKLRLYIIYFLTRENVPESEQQECEAALLALGCDISCMSYLKQLKAMTRLTEFGKDDKSGGAGSSKSLWGIGNKVLETGTMLVAQGVKNLLPSSSKLPATRIVDALMENRSSPETDDYRYFDPKLLRGNENMARARSTFTEAIVFIVGGGNYVEYENMRDYCQKQTIPKKIAYGTTEILTADAFLKQLNALGRKE